MSPLGNTNVQHKYVGEISIIRDMKIFDALPIELRAALRNSRLDFSAETVANIWKIQGVSIARIISAMQEIIDEIIAEEKRGAK